MAPDTSRMMASPPAAARCVECKASRPKSSRCYRIMFVTACIVSQPFCLVSTSYQPASQAIVAVRSAVFSFVTFLLFTHRFLHFGGICPAPALL